MPFTPFHMGPGLAAKAVLGRHLSLMVFGFSQVAIDVEPLVRIVRGDAVVHGITHTYFGAALVAAISVGLGRPICQILLNHWAPDPRAPFLNALTGARLIGWPAAIVGALVGTYSHVLLDSVMHADMRPFSPISDANVALRLISVGGLHVLCVVSGVFGALLLGMSHRRRRRG